MVDMHRGIIFHRSITFAEDDKLTVVSPPLEDRCTGRAKYFLHTNMLPNLEEAGGLVVGDQFIIVDKRLCLHMLCSYLGFIEEEFLFGSVETW